MMVIPKWLNVNNKKLSWILPGAFVAWLYIAGILGTLILKLDPKFYTLITILYIGVVVLGLLCFYMAKEYKKANMEDELSTGLVIIKYGTFISNCITCIVVTVLGMMLLGNIFFFLFGRPGKDPWLLPATAMFTSHFYVTFVLNLVYIFLYLKVTSYRRSETMRAFHIAFQFMPVLDIIDVCLIMMKRGKHFISSTIVLVLFCNGALAYLYYMWWYSFTNMNK